MRREGCGVSDSNRIWLNVECCGLTCASITWCIVLFCTYTFVVSGSACVLSVLP
jgi:hypothetical protein